MTLNTIKQPCETVLNYNYSEGKVFDTCEINEINFAIFHRPLESSEDLNIQGDYNVIFLAPIEAASDINIHAINVLALSTLHAKSGRTQVNSKNFYALGAELNNTVSIKTEQDSLLLGINGGKLHIEAGRDAVVGGVLTSHLEKIKSLYGEGIVQKDGKKIAEALLTTATILNQAKQQKGPAIQDAYAFLSNS